MGERERGGVGERGREWEVERMRDGEELQVERERR